ncbi:MAG: fibronectin type III domain-containing protein [Bacteroidales bacterium]|nr:fibronectin type III domain-containing protein [Bacteroidales bacterium]
MKNRLHKVCLLLGSILFMHLPGTVNASDITEVLPLTDQILMVHFDDGTVTHHKLGESRDSDVLSADTLNCADAVNVSSYYLSSTDDSNYASNKAPSSIGRKSKGTEFTMGSIWVQNWQKNSWASEHWIYLYLPFKMQTGKNYTLNTGTLAKNKNSFTFTYDEKNNRSEAVHVNQVGYLPSAQKKFGYVYHWMGDKGGLPLTSYANKNFWLIDVNSGEVKYTGQLKFRAAADNPETSQTNDTPNKNFLGAEVYECDFSTFNTSGKYRLAVEGIGCSFPFEIGEDIYRSSFKTTARGLYHNRSGIELTSEYTEFTRPADHNPNTTPGFAGKIRYSSVRSCDTQSDGGDGASIKALVESGDKGVLNTWGWYQDAGDWDGYPSHLRIPALLMLSYEMTPEKFSDNELNIPGKNNEIPDILDEARWLIEYLHRTRHAIMDAGYGTGGVSGRVCGDYWGNDMNSDTKTNGSWGDMRTWYVFGEDPMNTYMYAGLAAEYAYLLKLSGKSCPTNINWEQEAKEAYEWAKNNTREGDEKAPYAVVSLKDARMYAAANLYKLTGKNDYHARFIKDSENIGKNSTLSEDTRLSVYSYLLLDLARTQEDAITRFKSATSITADNMVSIAAEKRGCRWGGSFSMPMLVGQASTPYVLDALMDYKINNDQASLNDAITTVDYFMGNNPLNLIWFTGEKTDITNPDRRYVKGVFHMDSWYNTAKEDREVPGFSPYGPWRQEKVLDPNQGGNQGWWSNEWSYLSAYPAIQNNPNPMENTPTAWPGHERWFNQRYAPLACENTIHQNTVFWALTTGFLCKDVTSNPFDSNRLPAAEDFEALPDETEDGGATFLVADFDTKIFYTDENIADAPDGSYKVFTPGGSGIIADNPVKTGINTSEKSFEFTKNAGEWQVWGFETKGQVLDNFENYTALEFMVYGNLSDLRVVINNPADTDHPWLEEDIAVSASEGWQKIRINLPKEGTFNTILFFANKSTSEEGAKSYYDNIQFKIAESALSIADFDTKILYDEEGIKTAPEGSFKFYSTSTIEQPIDNPDKKAPNESEKVMKVTKGAGTWKLFGVETKDATPLDISRFTRFEFKVKGNVSELYIQIPESGVDNSQLIDVRTPISIDNEWMLFSLDISGKNGLFSNINIFPNPEIEEADAVFYFDDLKLIEKQNSGTTENETLQIFDFENIELGWGNNQQGIFAFNSANVSIEPNPDQSAPNESSRSLFWLKDSGNNEAQSWGGFGFPLKSSYRLDMWTHITFDVYTEEAMSKASVSFSQTGVPVLDTNGNPIKTSDGSQDSTIEVSKGQVTNFLLEVPARKWTTVRLDLSTLDFGGKPAPSDMTINQFIVFLGAEENAKYNTYTDNIRFEKIEVVPEAPQNLSATNVSANSFSLSWDEVTNTEIEKYEVYLSNEKLGKVKEKYGDSDVNTIDIKNLEAGETYTFHVKAVAKNRKVSDFSEPLIISTLTSIDDGDLQDETIHIYPNPVTSGQNITVSIPEGSASATITLYNLSGSMLRQEAINSSSSFTIHEAPGTYFIEVKTSTYKSIKKLAVY